MATSDITSSPAPARSSPQADLTWPFAFDVSAANAIAKLLGGDSPAVTVDSPSRHASPNADLAWPFTYEVSAANAIAKLIEAG